MAVHFWPNVRPFILLKTSKLRMTGPLVFLRLLYDFNKPLEVFLRLPYHLNKPSVAFCSSQDFGTTLISLQKPFVIFIRILIIKNHL